LAAPVGYDLWLLDRPLHFAESFAGSADAILLSPETVILRAVYVPAARVVDLAWARNQFTGGQVHLLRPVHSSDGPPFRSAFVYVPTGNSQAMRLLDPRPPGGAITDTYAYRYQAARRGEYAWAQDFEAGHPGFFLTGTGSSALWRVARVEQDALHRDVVTLSPVRLPHGLATPNFDVVPDERVRAYLREQFEAFQRAVASAAYLEIVDRAANIAEGVLSYCLADIGQPVPSTLAQRLAAARGILDDKSQRRDFRLTSHAYHLAHKIRELHARIHANQAVERGQTVRPEVGLGVPSDLSELLVEVGLARY